MSLEKITKIVKNRVENFKSERELVKLLKKGDGFMATVRFDNDEKKQGKRLNIRGFYPEDILVGEAKKAGKGTIVDVSVTRKQEIIGSVSIRNI